MRAWKDIDGLIAPRRARLQQLGFKTDAEAINHLLTFSDAFERDPRGTVEHLARQAGLLGPQQNNQGTVNPPPMAQPEMPDIGKVVEDHLGMAFARREIEDFAANSKDYPHFNQLRPVMSELLMSGRAENLDTAYKKALRLDDSLFQEEIDRLAREKAAKASSSQVERVAKAKTATRASISGAPHGIPATRAASKQYANPHDDAVADVRAAMEQIGAG
jgi:hypothetical protein